MGRSCLWTKALTLVCIVIVKPYGPSTRQCALKLQCSFHSLWMGWRQALPNCIVVPSRRFASVTRFESWEKFNFSSFDGSVSQSNNMPVQALANQTVCLCVRGGRLMWLNFGRASDTPAGKLQRTLPCARTVSVCIWWKCYSQAANSRAEPGSP